ncbi:MAG: methylisocitrate lyase [Fimbriimonadaceae bacterium]
MLTAPITHPGAALRALMADRTVVLPGVFNAISAISAAKAGAQGLYLSGGGLTNATLGVPDVGLATLTEFAQAASAITSIVQLPVISDADTGFGEAFNVRRTVIEMERAGLAGIHLEDQVSPKRCGHLDGKRVIDTADMVAKVRAAVSSKRDTSFLIVARTDARGVEGLRSALDRARAYAEAGADVIFPEGLESETEFEAFRQAVDVPLLANMTEFGKTPIIPTKRFEDLGYSLVIFPMTAFRVMLKALDETYAELVDKGTQADILGSMRTRAELYERLDYSDYDRQDRAWAAKTNH